MFLAEIGKFVGAKIAGTLIALAVLAGAYWCYQHPEELKAFGGVVQHTLIWLLVAAALPWSSYLYMKPLLEFESHLQSTHAAVMTSISVIALYTLADIILAFYLAGGAFSGAFTWLVVLLGFAAAAAYNFVICESLARAEGA